MRCGHAPMALAARYLDLQHVLMIVYVRSHVAAHLGSSLGCSLAQSITIPTSPRPPRRDAPRHQLD